MGNEKQKFGLFTAISMIVGVVIGSGIFFKTDEILIATGGNIAIGVLVFCIGAFCIIFGSLSVAQLAVASKKQDGVVGYYEEFVSKRVATGFSWFQLFVYFPSLCMVISYVGGGYLCTLFRVFLDGIGRPTPAGHVIMGLLASSVIFIFNVISEKFAAYFQNATTIIKLIPIVVIAIAGFFSSGENIPIPDNMTTVAAKDVGFAWIAALVPVAFSYEGWIISTNMSSDVKNPKKTLPLALTNAPIIVLTAYILYFVGISKMLGVEYVMTMRNAAVRTAGKMIFGSFGDKILLIFIAISVFGVVNGVFMGMLKLPKILQNKQMLPSNGKGLTSKICSNPMLLTAVLCLVWSIVQYVIMKGKFLKPGSDATSVAVVLGYVFYSILYIRVMMMKEIKSITKRFVFPILALFGVSIILIGGASADPWYTVMFTLFCAIIFTLGFYYNDKNDKVPS